MESNWAAENLQTIRTLMERSAVYRRALAPIFTFVGAVGIAAAIIAWSLKIESPRSFAVYWLSVCVVVIVGAFILVRRQALKSAEPFWSPPTRRIAQAMVPPLLAGLAFGLILGPNPNFLALIWTLFYGLALHAASFFMPRGIRLFSWGFLIAGLVLSGFVLNTFYFSKTNPDWNVSPHLLMGALFGLSHLACGIYLYFTEPRKNEA
jgi:hypothetical protein